MQRVTRASTSPVKRPPSPAASPTKRVKPSAPILTPPPPSALPIPSPLTSAEDDSTEILLHPVLTFSFADARKHLIAADSRWETIMDRLKCKPYEEESDAPFDPFKSLATSLLGQQISWLAARSITHKFCRLFDPTLSEKPLPVGTPQTVPTPFPTPHQILALPNQIPALRSAGLSGRKVEYVIELAQRFVDGRLDAKKLWDMDDETVKETLLEVRGIGIWTVQMFLMFSMRRPDILAVGDLGLQKGLAKWYSTSSAPSINTNKLPPVVKESPSPVIGSASDDVPSTPTRKPLRCSDPYPTPSSPTPPSINVLAALGEAELPDGIIELESPSKQGRTKKDVKKLDSTTDVDLVLPLTAMGLTSAALRSRLNGKKVKGNYLTPQEMEELTSPWVPYRSVACWYLWSLTDGTGDP